MNKAVCVLVALVSVGLTSSPSFANSAFEGVWKVTDSSGKPFEITLSADGTAKSTLLPMMVGSWKEEGNAAVIRWNTFWVTKIMKQGGAYKKIAYKRDESMSAPPYNTSPADKEK